MMPNMPDDQDVFTMFHSSSALKQQQQHQSNKYYSQQSYNVRSASGWHICDRIEYFAGIALKPSYPSLQCCCHL
jgi:hypothetical protein